MEEHRYKNIFHMLAPADENAHQSVHHQSNGWVLLLNGKLCSLPEPFLVPIDL